MGLSWFCVWQADSLIQLDGADRIGLEAVVRECPGLTAGHILTPAVAHDPYFAGHGGSPSLILQQEFSDIDVLERNLQPGAHLACLADDKFMPSLRKATPQQQTMLTRRFSVPSARPMDDVPTALSYWVEYSGPAEDENAWHEFYVRSHAPLLTLLPGVRVVEIYMPVVAVCGMGLPERKCMQRNKTVFDSADAMNVAMQSPVRARLREDVSRFPPFSGAAHHFAFDSMSYRGASAGGACRP